MPVLSTLLRRVGGQPWFATVGRAYVRVDTLLGRLSKGRLVALNQRALPSALLTTTGRRTGRSRLTPLLYAPDGDAFVVIGSNWGRPEHPGWSANLLAHPAATLTRDGEEIAVRGHLATGAERVRLRELLLTMWPAYAVYERRSGGRHLRIFRLERL